MARQTAKPKRSVRRVGLGSHVFRAVWIRGGKKPVVLSTAESVTWNEPDDSVTPVRTGTLSIAQPGYKQPLRFLVGEQIRLDVAERPGAPFREVWQMRITAPSHSYVSGRVSLEVADDLALLQRSESAFLYVKTKSRKRGWRYDEVVADVAQRYGFEVLSMPKGKKYHTSLGTKTSDAPLFSASPLDIILAAVRKEQEATGRRFTIRWTRKTVDGVVRRGLVIALFTPSPLLFEFAPSIIEAVESAQLKEEFATQLTVRNFAVDGTGTDTSGTKKKAFRQITVAVPGKGERNLGAERFGYVHRNVFSTNGDSIAELRNAGKRRLSQVAVPDKALTVSHPGVPWLRRGHTVHVMGREKGLDATVFVQSISHSVQSSGYTMDVTFGFQQPYAVYPTDSLTEDYVAKADTAKATAKKTAAPKPERAAARETTPKTTQRSWTDNIKPYGS